jgi:hypothetical protein
MQLVRRLFYRLYPTKPKATDNEEGDRLRFVLGCCVIVHLVFFLVSLTAIGFKSMLFEIALGLWSYSCHLTLREWQCLLYIVGLLIGILHGLFSIFYFSKINLLFFILNIVLLCIAFWFVCRRYYKFRVAGGIHGTNGRTKIKPDEGIKASLLID